MARRRPEGAVGRADRTTDRARRRSAGPSVRGRGGAGHRDTRLRECSGGPAGRRSRGVVEGTMAEIERSAASVEEAIEAALAELGISEQEAHVEIVQEGRSGFLGLAAQPAIVRVRASSGVPRGGPAEESSEELEEQLGVAEEFVHGLLERMGVRADVETAMIDGVAYVEVWSRDDGDDVGILIGRRGHTLESVQE